MNAVLNLTFMPTTIEQIDQIARRIRELHDLIQSGELDDELQVRLEIGELQCRIRELGQEPTQPKPCVSSSGYAPATEEYVDLRLRLAMLAEALQQRRPRLTAFQRLVRSAQRHFGSEAFHSRRDEPLRAGSAHLRIAS